MVNADSRGITVLAGMASSKLTGGSIWNIHVLDLAGVATTPYFVDVVLVRHG